MVPPASDKISRVSPYSGSHRSFLRFRLQGLHLLWLRFRSHSSIKVSPFRGPSTPSLRTVWAPPVSLAATPGITVVFFSSRYLDVSVPWVPLHALSIHAWMTGFFPAGFPHSDICGSLLPNGSPQLFAVWHVLLQFRVARHSPYALPYLISGFRVFFEIFLHKNCFLTTVSFLHTFSVNLTTFVIDLFCYVFFMLFSFQRSIIEKSFDPSKPNKNYPLRKISISYIFSFSLERR